MFCLLHQPADQLASAAMFRRIALLLVFASVAIQQPVPSFEMVKGVSVDDHFEYPPEPQHPSTLDPDLEKHRLR